MASHHIASKEEKRRAAEGNSRAAALPIDPETSRLQAVRDIHAYWGSLPTIQYAGQTWRVARAGDELLIGTKPTLMGSLAIWLAVASQREPDPPPARPKPRPTHTCAHAGCTNPIAAWHPHDKTRRLCYEHWQAATKQSKVWGDPTTNRMVEEQARAPRELYGAPHLRKEKTLEDHVCEIVTNKKIWVSGESVSFDHSGAHYFVREYQDYLSLHIIPETGAKYPIPQKIGPVGMLGSRGWVLCPDWQATIRGHERALAMLPSITVRPPRREGLDIDDNVAA